jgi:hypothetical protein
MQRGAPREVYPATMTVTVANDAASSSPGNIGLTSTETGLRLRRYRKSIER